MRKYFVWTRDIERVISEALSDKKKRLTSNSDAILTLFSRGAEASEHYYTAAVTMYRGSRVWKCINKSGIYRMLERNQQLWEGVGLIFSAIELQKVLVAPPGSIVITTLAYGGYGFEVIKPTDPNYKEAYARLPGAA